MKKIFKKPSKILDSFNENKIVYLVVDSDVNQKHYKDFIGKAFTDPPTYATIKAVPISYLRLHKINLYNYKDFINVTYDEQKKGKPEPVISFSD